jgi:hypothetical protein
MENPVEQAKADLGRAAGRLKTLLTKTPEDKLNWSPSPTSRTPVQIVGHSATSIEGIQSMLMGEPFAFSSTAEMDSRLMESEKEFTSPEQVTELLDKNTAAYDAGLDSLTPEQVASTVHSPMGPMPLSVAIMFPAMHTLGHCGQLEYVQTIYGDRDWYYG